MAALILFGSLLSACSLEAGAQHTAADKAEPAWTADISANTKAPTMAECRALTERAEKITCMTVVREALRAENAALDRAIETEVETGKQLDTTIDVLTEISEAVDEASEE